MGYSLNGRCYENDAEALKAFNLTFPVLDGGSLNTLVSSSISSGLVTYNVSSRQWNSNTLASRSGTAQLTACTDSYINKFQALAVQDIEVGALLLIAFVIGASMGYSK